VRKVNHIETSNNPVALKKTAGLFDSFFQYLSFQIEAARADVSGLYEG